MKSVWATFVLINNKLAPTGMFATESDALAQCHPTEGVVEFPIGEKFPTYVSELPKCYWPHRHRWEDSQLFHIQQRAANVVREFFAKPTA